MRRYCWWVLPIFLGILSAIQLGSQSTNAAVYFGGIPEWGQDGRLSGYVYGADTSRIRLYLYKFIPDLGWITMADCAAVQIQGTGQFSIDATPNITDRYATRYSAYLVPASLNVPCVQGAASIPFLIEHNALNRATLPRLAQYKTLSFGGLEWNVKSAPVKVYPGPQFFVQDNAFVDALGQLHLKLTQCSGSWCAAEIFTKETVGYGNYSFTINSPVNALDPNVTFGIFNWDGQAGDESNREWDIEFGRWGNAGASANAQYVVQPYNGPNNLSRFVMSPATQSTHSVAWAPAQIRFSSSVPSALGNTVVSQWNYPAGALPVPAPGDVHLHLNLYVAVGQSPVSPIGQEIVISRMQYEPSGAQIGFSRTTESASFLAGVHSTLLDVQGQNCIASVESDSPWLSVVGSNQVLGAVQYAVSDNVGSSRLGHLILQGKTCNATIGRQVLEVTQAGLVCSPTFETDSSHVGFIQSVRSVIVRGTAPSCSWTVSSSAPWLQIVTPRAGAGDGVVEFSTSGNTEDQLRSGRLVLNNNQQHTVYQDGAGAYLALSPLVSRPCGSNSAQFAVSWVARGNVEIRLNSPNGAQVGQFGPSGSVLLPQLANGGLVYLMQAPPYPSSVTLASTRATVLAGDCNSAAIGPQGVLNSASYSATSIAPGSLAGIFGRNLSGSISQTNSGTFSTSLGGVNVELAGERCALSYVSPSQINFLVPSGLTPGRYLLTVGNASTEVIVTGVSPGIFTISGDGAGVAFASVLAVLNDGSAISLSPYRCDSLRCSGVPIDLPPDLTELHIILYGTGLRGFRDVSATVGPLAAEVLFIGAQSQFPGLDQVNLRLKSTAGLHGRQVAQLFVDGLASNGAELHFR